MLIFLPQLLINNERPLFFNTANFSLKSFSFNEIKIYCAVIDELVTDGYIQGREREKEFSILTPDKPGLWA